MAGRRLTDNDFEEMFTILEGEIQFTFRGEKTAVRAGQTINIPANAPHFFRNTSDTTARMVAVSPGAGFEHWGDARPPTIAGGWAGS